MTNPNLGLVKMLHQSQIQDRKHLRLDPGLDMHPHPPGRIVESENNLLHPPGQNYTVRGIQFRHKPPGASFFLSQQESKLF